MRFTTEAEAIAYLFHSRDQRTDTSRGLDEQKRDLSPTRDLLLATGLPSHDREYVVITGSKGKGSTAAITAKLLQHLGHRTGLVTGPHLRTWYERIRIDGEMIPPADFRRILSDLAPKIDTVQSHLTGAQYISPQGILLLIALRWFNERQVAAAVIEVGRGGRFDDMSLVPNNVALFTPIILEHTQYMGNSLERIAWHKSGIIPYGGYAYSVAQDPEVMTVLTREAETRDCEFFWFSTLDMGKYLDDTPDGVRFQLGRYGECELSLMGHYQIPNATLAVQAAGNMHARLKGIAHGSSEYVERIKAGLRDVTWFGRCQRLQESPLVFVDGAINPLSAKSFLASVRSRLRGTVVIVAGVPQDRDYAGVYAVLTEQADALILTASTINPAIRFPSETDALTAARAVHRDVTYLPALPDALQHAKERAGSDGTVLLSVAQPLVGEAMILYDVDTSRI